MFSLPLSSPNRKYADMEVLEHPVSIAPDKPNILILYPKNSDPSMEFQEFFLLHFAMKFFQLLYNFPMTEAPFHGVLININYKFMFVASTLFY